jgi:deoxyribodipyrimidine photo-lyase
MCIRDRWWAGLEKSVPRLTLHEGVTLAPPGAIRTTTGGRYRVFTPYWRAHREWGPPPGPVGAPRGVAFADTTGGERLEDWGLLPVKPDWAGGFDAWEPGETGAGRRLRAFMDRVADYEAGRNLPAEEGTARLSPHLHHGEISAARCWHEAVEAVAEAKAEPWLRQLVWRDFAHETLDQFPHSATRPHREAFDRMPWTDLRTAEGRTALEAWQRGRTGYPMVDAGMRQLWTTGWMHNRVRMVTASFLTKHLMIDWRRGEEWFWDTLVDADLANNAMGWQWVMGSGVDSSPYHRVFNPVTQAAKFEAGAYIRRWVPELADRSDEAVHGPFDRGCGDYPPPIVDHGAARERALDAWRAIRG